jgi:hypothetical protein
MSQLTQCDLIRAAIESVNEDLKSKQEALDNTTLELVECQKAIAAVLQSNMTPSALLSALYTLREQVRSIQNDILCLHRQLTTLQAILDACERQAS